MEFSKIIILIRSIHLNNNIFKNKNKYYLGNSCALGSVKVSVRSKGKLQSNQRYFILSTKAYISNKNNCFARN